jgi:hypothetical protein
MYFAGVLVLASAAAGAAVVVVVAAAEADEDADADIAPESASGYSDEILSLLSSFHRLHLHYQ